MCTRKPLPSSSHLQPSRLGSSALQCVVGNIRAAFSSGTFLPVDVADPNSHFYDVDNVSVHYKLDGCPLSDATETIVCSHGFGSNTVSFEAIAPHLILLRKSAPAAVLSFDSPGFGLTSRPPLRRLHQYYPRFATQIVAALAPRTATNILMGHSLGSLGVIASALASAEKGGSLPRALVLIAPAVVTGSRVQSASRIFRTLAAFPALLLLLVSVLVGPILNLTLRLIVGRGPNFWQRGLAAARASPDSLTQREVDGYRRPLKVRGWAGGFVNFVRAMILQGVTKRKVDLIAELASICPNLPILIIHGEKDRLVPLDNSRRLQDALQSQSKLVVIADAGHVPHEEMPAACAQHISAFLDSLP
jgi:pimeloyl-ACP methyl ester carboxylesterase